jgi:hypothetical protein
MYLDVSPLEQDDNNDGDNNNLTDDDSCVCQRAQKVLRSRRVGRLSIDSVGRLCRPIMQTQ